MAKQSDVEWLLDYLKRILDANKPADETVNRISELVAELRTELHMGH